MRFSKKTITDGRTNMGDYQGPRLVNLGSKIETRGSIGIAMVKIQE